MIWIVFAVMTAVVVAALLVPVLRQKPSAAAGDRNSYDRAVFRDQLAELDRDVERGTIGPVEAEAARNEISRRLIAAGGPPRKAVTAGVPVVALIATLIIPAVALPLYLRTGSPQLPDVPLALRMEQAEANQDYEALIVKVEKRLADHPDDLAGWKVLAPFYLQAMRWADAIEARRNILRLSPADAGAMADYGEALVMANQALVSAEAHGIFAEALAIDPKLPKARFYMALALKQEGKRAEAKAAFEAFLADTPDQASWRPTLLAEIQDLNSKPPVLDGQTVKEAASMTPADRQAMILSMVDGLEEKLKTDGSDLEGWLRLIRARSVLGDTAKAKSAYDTAKARFEDDASAMAALDGLAKEMNIP